MKHRLACVDVPNVALQLLVKQRPEWTDEPVVLLDRDEANGRIIDANTAAANLGLLKGMMYGPSLGMHPRLKGGVISPEVLEDLLERLEGLLMTYTPFVERAWFRRGTYWLDAGGLSHLFPSMKSWMALIREAVAELGFDGNIASGFSRFGTYAAACLKPMGTLNIFSSREAEDSWVGGVPIGSIPMDGEALTLFHRLKLLTIGDLMRLPLPDVRRRLSGEAAKMAAFIRDEGLLPLQYLDSPEAAEWTMRPEDPVCRREELYLVGCRLLDRCLEKAHRLGKRILAVDFRMMGESLDLDASLKPAYPTRDRARLLRLLRTRIDYLEFPNPVREITCRCRFTAAGIAQMELFGQKDGRTRSEAERILTALQAERGKDAVRCAEIVDHPLPTRGFLFRPWSGFSSVPPTAPEGDGSGKPVLARRILFHPRPVTATPNVSAYAVYSGGWWSVPYGRELAYARADGLWHWFQKEGDDSWNLIGWVD